MHFHLLKVLLAQLNARFCSKLQTFPMFSVSARWWTAMRNHLLMLSQQRRVIRGICCKIYHIFSASDHTSCICIPGDCFSSFVFQSASRCTVLPHARWCAQKKTPDSCVLCNMHTKGDFNCWKLLRLGSIPTTFQWKETVKMNIVLLLLAR